MNIQETNSDAIQRRPLHIEVADRLRELIHSGELAPGERLNERQLSERFAISRTPLRDAIKLLSSEGLVTLLPNRGALVTEITRAEAEDMFQVMAVLESLSGELACARATDEDIAEIRSLHYDMQAFHRRGELEEYFRLNQQIHEKIVDIARNEELKAIYRSLSGRIRGVRYMANYSQKRWNEAMAEHEKIFEALTTRDSERLKALLRQHLENKFAVIQAWLAEEVSSEEGSVEK